MADIVASTEGSDVLRLSALFNRILGEEKIRLSLPVQLLCDAMMGARPDFLLAVNTQGIILFASSACSELAGVSGQALEGEVFETFLDIEDRTRFRQFMADSVLPMAGKSFSKLGPLDVRIAPLGKTSSNTIRWAALRVGSIDLLPDSRHQDALFFSA